MDRELVLHITRKAQVNILSTKDVSEVIAGYCMEKGKDELLSQRLISYLVVMNLWQNPFSIALEYYQKKFGICTLTDVEGKVIIIF